jgi:alpha-L-rhamnosidase
LDGLFFVCRNLEARSMNLIKKLQRANNSIAEVSLASAVCGTVVLLVAVIFFRGTAHASGRSEPDYRMMGLLKPSDWHGKWIGLDGVAETTWLEDAYPGFEGPSTRMSWIWFPVRGEPQKSAAPGTFYFRREIIIPPEKPPVKEVHFQFAGDSTCRAWINGFDLGRQRGFHSVSDADVTYRVKPGRNVICLMGVNDGPKPKPAGVIAYLEIEFTRGDSLLFWTDEEWKASNKEEKGWTELKFDDSKWVAAKSLGQFGMQPWGNVRTPEGRRQPARYLRKDFTIDKKVARATVYFSGLGWSELYLNGGKVGDGVLSPEIADYAKRVFYVNYDVTKQLRHGTNTFGVILGNGTYYAPRSEVSTGVASFGWPKMRLQLRVEYSDGSTSEVVSDESWQLTIQGPIRANNIYDGEDYDANYDLTGWNSPDYNAAPVPSRERGTVVPEPAWKPKWQPAQTVHAPAGELVPQMTEPIRVAETLKPIAFAEPQPGVFVFDMGRSITGWCRLKVRGPAQPEVMLRHAESLKPDGSLDLSGLGGAKAMDIYKARAKGGDEVWEPRFTCHRFRYVEVTGYPGKPTLHSIEGQALTKAPTGH